MQYLLEHAAPISALLFSFATVAVSPVVWIRHLRAKNELAEAQTIVKKNRTIREEIALINAELDQHREKIRELEDQLHEERLQKRELHAQIEKLKTDNAQLQQQLGNQND